MITYDVSLRIGDRVKIRGQESVGEVVEVCGFRATVSFTRMEIHIPIQQLERTSDSGKALSLRRPKTRLLNLDTATFFSFDTEIDLHGMSVHEAIHALDAWIDRASLLRHQHLKVIHGKGAGILRHAVRKHCQAHPQVKHVDALHPYAGGTGVTGLELV